MAEPIDLNEVRTEKQRALNHKRIHDAMDKWLSEGSTVGGFIDMLMDVAGAGRSNADLSRLVLAKPNPRKATTAITTMITQGAIDGLRFLVFRPRSKRRRSSKTGRGAGDTVIRRPSPRRAAQPNEPDCSPPPRPLRP